MKKNGEVEISQLKFSKELSLNTEAFREQSLLFSTPGSFLGAVSYISAKSVEKVTKA